ncbi:MAG: periplasmic protein TonB [Acidobacteriota bacterium]|jgi:protein TonB|nr:periplasmic protein TonB [Acidobacteriota bacterium]
MFDDVLIESAAQHRQQGGPLTAMISITIHLGFIAAIVAAGYHVHDRPTATETRIRAFVVTQAARAAPPPPPPPLAAPQSGTIVPRRRVEPDPAHAPEVFRQPTVIPVDLPAVPDLPEVASDETPLPGAMPGGVAGGKQGGIVGGQIGGERGGDLDGVIGGAIGGTGTRTGPDTGGGGDAPVRVGGNVKAPQLVLRVEPVYTEAARIAHIRGIVIIEAVIDRKGYVQDARVLRALPMGLDQSALNAVRQWRFRPGTLNGNPVPVLYNLTINFELH